MRGVGGVAERDPAAGEGTGAAPYPSAGSNPAPSTEFCGATLDPLSCTRAPGHWGDHSDGFFGLRWSQFSGNEPEAQDEKRASDD